MKKLFISSIIISASLLGIVSAHQPRVVINNETEISKPEISQAFYGILSGQSEKFTIIQSEPWNLSVQLNAPDISGSRTDFNADITSSGMVVGTLRGTGAAWNSFHEEFGNDDYLSGPSLKKELPAGQYEVTVYNAENTGKYVMVIGSEEKFPLNEIGNAMITVPYLKVHFFDKSVLSRIPTIVGLAWLSLLIILALISLLIIFIYRRVMIKKTRKK